MTFKFYLVWFQFILTTLALGAPSEIVRVIVNGTDVADAREDFQRMIAAIQAQNFDAADFALLPNHLLPDDVQTRLFILLLYRKMKMDSIYYGYHPRLEQVLEIPDEDDASPSEPSTNFAIPAAIGDRGGMEILPPGMNPNDINTTLYIFYVLQDGVPVDMVYGYDLDREVPSSTSSSKSANTFPTFTSTLRGTEPLNLIHRFSSGNLRILAYRAVLRIFERFAVDHKITTKDKLMFLRSLFALSQDLSISSEAAASRMMTVLCGLISFDVQDQKRPDLPYSLPTPWEFVRDLCFYLKKGLSDWNHPLIIPGSQPIAEVISSLPASLRKIAAKALRGIDNYAFDKLVPKNKPYDHTKVGGKLSECEIAFDNAGQLAAFRAKMRR